MGHDRSRAWTLFFFGVFFNQAHPIAGICWLQCETADLVCPMSEVDLLPPAITDLSESECEDKARPRCGLLAI